MTLLTPEVLLKTQAAVDQVRLSRLETQIAIKRTRKSLAETRALIVALQFACSPEKHKETSGKTDAYDAGGEVGTGSTL